MLRFKEIVLLVFSYVFAFIRFLMVWIATFFMGLQKVLFDGVQVENIVLSCKPLFIDLDKISYLDKLAYGNEDDPEAFLDDIFKDEGDEGEENR